MVGKVLWSEMSVLFLEGGNKKVGVDYSVYWFVGEGGGDLVIWGCEDVNCRY